MLLPNAEKKLIPPGSSDPRITARTGILHVDAGNNYDLYSYFNGPSGGIESHGHFPKTRTPGGKGLFQYRNTDYQADANYLANAFALSFESQGFAGEPWNDFQLENIQETILICRRLHHIPLRTMRTWNDPRGGWGYHTLFGAPSEWTPNVKSCPGPVRKEQYHDLLVPWMKEVSTVALSKEDKEYFEAEFKQLHEHINKSRKVTSKQILKNREVVRNRFGLTDEQLDEVTALLSEE